jgi:hypothetical protein
MRQIHYIPIFVCNYRTFPRSCEKGDEVDACKNRRNQSLDLAPTSSATSLDVKCSHRTHQRNRRVLVVVSKQCSSFCSRRRLSWRHEGARQMFLSAGYQLTTIEIQTDGNLQREQV